MTEALIEVCSLEDLPDGAILKRRIGRRTIAVARRDDQLLAFLPSCPHRGGPLECGRVVPLLDGDSPGAPRLLEGRFVIACPWHGWEFELSSGVSVVDPSVTLRTFPCEVRDGRVFVDLRVQAGAA